MDHSIVIVNMVAKNCKGFTRREYEGAKAARRALGLVGVPVGEIIYQHGKFQHDSELPCHTN